MFFFFKQKTAYEMRISDWSSDVCSSDLTVPSDPDREDRRNPRPPRPRGRTDYATNERLPQWLLAPLYRRNRSDRARAGQVQSLSRWRIPWRASQSHGAGRSEEHKSELQSLMRISYAVFCLKKKNNHKQT